MDCASVTPCWNLELQRNESSLLGPALNMRSISRAYDPVTLATRWGLHTASQIPTNWSKPLASRHKLFCNGSDKRVLLSWSRAWGTQFTCGWYYLIWLTILNTDQRAPKGDRRESERVNSPKIVQGPKSMATRSILNLVGASIGSMSRHLFLYCLVVPRSPWFP